MSLLSKIQILYEDENMVCINKPAGLIVHADGRKGEESVVDWMLVHYPEAKDVGEPKDWNIEERIKNQENASIPNSKFLIPNSTPALRAGVVHRLDRDTSGVMVLAKNQKAFLHLKKQFQEREIEKIYHAFVYGVMKKDEGTIDRPIARSRKDFRLWSAQRGGRGEMREAITDYEVLLRADIYTFVEVRPKTGRTHQIRVHFKAINHPIVCDKLYAPKQKPILDFERLALHARTLKLQNLNGEPVEVTAPYPEDFEKAIKKSGYLPH